VPFFKVNNIYPSCPRKPRFRPAKRGILVTLSVLFSRAQPAKRDGKYYLPNLYATSPPINSPHSLGIFKKKAPNRPKNYHKKKI
jgi:hypothetical protein